MVGTSFCDESAVMWATMMTVAGFAGPSDTAELYFKLWPSLLVWMDQRFRRHLAEVTDHLTMSI